MKSTDATIKQDVLDELAWMPNIDETQVGVIVQDGIVTLTGIVDSYSKKLAAEKAVKNVKGVKAIAEDIKVRYGTSYKKTDSEIAKACVNALSWNNSIPTDSISEKVENGNVYLTGEVNWEYQKKEAKRALQNLSGVKNVINNITLKQSVKPLEIKERISKAFKRSATIDAKNVNVHVNGHTVKLTGKVHSLLEKDEARKAAYHAPGVYAVDNELEVQY
jgi:osmotically-inducible protein OsmY